MGGIEAHANTKHEIYEATISIPHGGPRLYPLQYYYCTTMDLEDTHVGPGIKTSIHTRTLCTISIATGKVYAATYIRNRIHYVKNTVMTTLDRYSTLRHMHTAAVL